MFGRSSRRQDTQVGVAYLVGQKASMISPWERIKNREGSAKELGGELVRIILKAQDKIKSSEYEVLRDGINKGKEKTSIHKMNFSDDPFLKLLKTLEKRLN